MYIRRTTIKSRKSGKPYVTYRLCESERVGGKVKQRTLLNLGRHFNLPREQWQLLSARIEELLERGRGKEVLLELELPEELETLAQRYVAQILAKRGRAAETQPAAAGDFQTIDLDSLELIRPRSIGVEHAALSAMTSLGLLGKLTELGFNRHQLAAAVGNIVGRMAAPGSESATHRWLQQRSGLGELLNYDYEGMVAERLYQASDLLWKHREALEAHLYGAEQALFRFQDTITLYDLTNTYFEGESCANPQAKRGKSKEKRSDCPLVTLGLVLDGSGFPRHSQIFSGNASEPETLAQMLGALHSQPGTTVVMDAGLATEENITWLREQDYRYLVVSRKRKRCFDPEASVMVKETPGQQVRVQRVVNEAGEVELYCHSIAREAKEQAMQDRARERFEQALQKLHDGLSRKGTTKKYGKIMERIGRLREKYSRAAQHYHINVDHDPDSDNATAIRWQRREKPQSQATDPGIYALRTDLIDWDEATLWNTYTLLTDLEAVFRSLKSELGLRPIYHQNPERVSGHLFISLLAYHLVHTLRTKLKASGIDHSWESLRSQLEGQQRVTVTLQGQDGRTYHIRKSSRAEPQQKTLYDALDIDAQPGPVQKNVVGGQQEVMKNL
jgi:transposase